MAVMANTTATNGAVIAADAATKEFPRRYASLSAQPDPLGPQNLTLSFGVHRFRPVVVSRALARWWLAGLLLLVAPFGHPNNKRHTHPPAPQSYALENVLAEPLPSLLQVETNISERLRQLELQARVGKPTATPTHPPCVSVFL